MSFDGLDPNDVREMAYKIFFTACRSSPGLGGRKPSISTPTTHWGRIQVRSREGGGSRSGHIRGNSVEMAPTRRLKRTLGLKMLRWLPSRRVSSGGGGGSAPSSSTARENGGRAQLWVHPTVQVEEHHDLGVDHETADEGDGDYGIRMGWETNACHGR